MKCSVSIENLNDLPCVIEELYKIADKTEERYRRLEQRWLSVSAQILSNKWWYFGKVTSQKVKEQYTNMTGFPSNKTKLCQKNIRAYIQVRKIRDLAKNIFFIWETSTIAKEYGRYKLELENEDLNAIREADFVVKNQKEIIKLTFF